MVYARPKRTSSGVRYVWRLNSGSWKFRCSDLNVWKRLLQGKTCFPWNSDLIDLGAFCVFMDVYGTRQAFLLRFIPWDVWPDDFWTHSCLLRIPAPLPAAWMPGSLNILEWSTPRKTLTRIRKTMENLHKLKLLRDAKSLSFENLYWFWTCSIPISGLMTCKEGGICHLSHSQRLGC